MSTHVTLPDGSRLELPDGASGADVAAAIGPGLARAALAIEVFYGSVNFASGTFASRAPRIVLSSTSVMFITRCTL